MTVQPPGRPEAAPQATPPPLDRRAPERRSGNLRRAEDRAQFARVAAASALAICGGLAILFVFFWLLGAIDVKNAVGTTVVAVLLALVWLGGLIYRRRTVEEDAGVRREALQYRERRGF